MSALERTLSHLERLVAFPTVSSAGNLALITYLAEVLDEAGAQVQVMYDPSGGKANLFATLGPERDGGIVLSGHTDVVPVTDQHWTTDPFAMSRHGSRLYGRGTCDMKGFIASALAMAPEFAARTLHRPVHFAFTYDEEVGCLGAQSLVAALEAQRIRPAIAVIGEPTKMRTVEAHKGCCEYTVTFTGLEGHGSAPERGVNAVGCAVRYAAQLLALEEELKARAPEASPFEPPWSTINIGRLSGGSAHNVIPGLAVLDWEMRPVQPSDRTHVLASLAALTERMREEMRAVHPGAGIDTQVIGEVAGLEREPESAARALTLALTGRSEAETVPFGTEAGLFQELGTSAVVCGPGSIEQAHKPDEFIEVDELTRCLEMLEGLGAQVQQAA